MWWARHCQASYPVPVTGLIVALRYYKVTTVKPVLVATSIKQATCIKQACSQFPKKLNTLKCICIKQASVLSKNILFIP